jgi:hypothetical protein
MSSVLPPPVTNGQSTTYGLWIKARLKELLDPALYANLGDCTIERMWSEHDWTARVAYAGRQDCFTLRCQYDRRHGFLPPAPADLARLILFLQ